MKSKSFALFAASAAVLGSLALTMTARAADQTWLATGPSADWNTTEPNWDAGVVWAQSNSAIFDSTGETVTLTEPITVGNLTFGSDGYIIAGNTLTLNASTIANGANNATISSALAGSSLAKTGTGTLTLPNANTFAGTVAVGDGTLAFTKTGNVSYGMSGLSVAAGATASFSSGGDIGFAAPITGTGTVLVTGALSSFRQTANNQAFTGIYRTESSGCIDFVNAAAGWSANADYVLNGAWLRLYGSSTGRTIDLGSLATTNAASSIGNWNGGGITVLSIGANGKSTSFAGKIVNAFGGGAIMALTKVGTGALTLSGANTYTGATSVNNGSLLLDGGSLSTGTEVAVADLTFFGGKGSAGAVSVAVGGGLQGGYANAGGLSLTSLNFAGNATLNLMPALGTTANIAVSGAMITKGVETVNITSATPLGTGTHKLVSYGSIGGAGIGAFTLGSTPANGAARVRAYALDTTTSPGNYLGLTVSGDAPRWTGGTNGAWDTTTTGNWKLVSDNTTATTFFSYDVVLFTDTATTKAVSINGADVNPGGVIFNNSAGNDYTLGGANGIAGIGGLIKSDGGTLTVTNANTYAGATTVNGGTLQFGDGSSGHDGSITGSVMNSAALIYNLFGNQTANYGISGAGTLTKTGDGTLTMLGSNRTYTGATTVDGGALVFTGDNIYTGTTTINAGTLKHDFSALGGPLGATAIKVAVGASGTLELTGGNSANADASYINNGATSLTGTGTIAKTGAGYLGLILNSAGVADFSGLIDVREGTLGNNGIAWAAGAGAMDLNVGADAYFDLRTQNVKIDKLSGAGMVARSHNSTWTLSVGNNDGSATFSGTLQNLMPAAGGGSNGGVLAFTKAGSGTQILSGDSTYTGATTVSAGTLLVDGSLGDTAVTVQTGATFGGTGFLEGSLATQAGGTLSPATVGSIGVLTVDGSLTLAGNLTLDIHKSGKILSSDEITGFGDLHAGGSLTITATGDSLALGDTFTLLSLYGDVTGAFAGVPALPSLLGGLRWDLSNLLVDGTIRVVNFISAPSFTPLAGGYQGTPAVTLTADSGATIYYTLDGSSPSSFSMSGASPLDIGNLPADATDFTVKAFARKAGQADSPVVAAVYNTITTPTWNVNSNGNWSESDSWMKGVIADGIGSPADFSFVAQSAPTDVTLDSNRTVGSMVFGNSNPFDWSIFASGASVLTLATGTGSPTIEVINQTATIHPQLAGTQGLTKTGPGTLGLSNASTLSGTVAVNNGTLAFTKTGAVVNYGMSGLSVAAGATASFNSGGDIGFAAPITGAGTVLLSGTLTSFRPSGDNQAFAGTFEVASEGNLDYINVSAGWSANASYIMNGPWIRAYGSSTGKTIDFGSLAGTNPTSSIGNWNAGAQLGTTLRVGAKGESTSFAGKIVDRFPGALGLATMALTKVGGGRLTLSGANTYTGATTVETGTLEVNGSLAAASAVTVNATATLAGTGTVGGAVAIQGGAFVAPGNAAIGTLSIGNITLSGTYQCQLDGTAADLAAIDSLTLSGTPTIAISVINPPTAASYTIATYTFIVGDPDSILVTGLPDGYTVDYLSEPGKVKLIGTASGYVAWADTWAGLTDKTPGGDPDNDGISNLMEYVIGGDPRVSSTEFLPKQSIVGPNLVLNYQRSDASEIDTTQIGQWSTNLTDWNDIAPVLVSENADAPDDMTISIPLTNAADGRLFGRLQVTQP